MKKILAAFLLTTYTALPLFADDNQDQHFSDDRVRPYAEMVQHLKVLTDSNLASIDTVYADLCANGSPTWVDNRSDGVPNKLTPADICAANAFFHDFETFWAAETGGSNTNGNALLKAVVRSQGQ